MLLVIGISILITVIMSFVFYGRAAELMQRRYEDVIRENLSSRADLFDDIMDETYRVCTYAAADRELQALVHADNSYEELTGILKKYQEQSEYIQSIYCCIDEAACILRVGTGSIQTAELTPEIRKWMQQITEPEREGSPFSPVFNYDSQSIISRHFLSFAQEIHGKDGSRTGCLFVNVDERELYYKCLKSGNVQTGSLYISQDGVIISARENGMIGTMPEISDHSLAVSVNMKETDYQMLSVSDRSIITADLRSITNWIILVVLLLNLFLCVPVLLIVRTMMNPLRELEQKMNIAKEGDLSVRAEIYHKDEIGSISENFNEMIAQIETLIDELVTQKMLKKEAEIEALQYQITPHFMYNTLSSIRYAAIYEHADDIAALLQAFIELLRMSASDRGAFITVEQEMKMVKNYCMLQQFRYENSFEAEFEVEPGTEVFCVPRLIVQPLVENAILHGLNHNSRGNLVTIQTRKSSRWLEIRVQDNGSGMTQEEIEQLLKGTRRSKFSGIGVNNVIERLRLYYGAEGRIEYTSVRNAGTTAMIRIPATENPEEYVI